MRNGFVVTYQAETTGSNRHASHQIPKHRPQLQPFGHRDDQHRRQQKDQRSLQHQAGLPTGQKRLSDYGTHRTLCLIIVATADAIIYATAQESNAELLTCDAHFEGLPGVIYQRTPA